MGAEVSFCFTETKKSLNIFDLFLGWLLYERNGREQLTDNSEQRAKFVMTVNS